MTDPARFRRIEAVFVAASQRPPEDRGEFLRTECADDSSIRREVEAMLAHEDDAALETPLHLSPVRAPDRIGDYDVVRRIGMGGMGAVYEAEQSRPQRRVALKVIRPDAFSQEMLGRFRHETEILGRLQHPGIAQIFEACVDGEQPFFVMEYVDGRPLTEFARRAQLSDRQRLELVAEICDAVHHAHQQGVVHRDLKSDNVLVTSDGSPKILDFGVARIIDADAGQKTQWTTAGQLVGTLAYMSPEQIRGSADTRTDVYALGVILYELLAGRLPFDFTGVPITEAARMICEDDPPRLGSSEIDAILGKALEKEKGRRYSSVAALAADVRRYLADLPLSARPATVWYQLRKYARRHRVAFLGATATVLALVAGLVSTAIQAVRATRHASVAERNEAAAHRTAYRASVAAASSALTLGDAPAARRQLDEPAAELRQWEWRHLNARLDVTEAVFRAESGPGSIAFRADGTPLFAGKSGVFDVRTGTPVRNERGDPIAVALSADGTTLATLDAGFTLRIRDTRTDRLRAESKLALKAPPVAFRLSEDGSVLEVSSAREMRFFESRTGTLRARHRIDASRRYFGAAFVGSGTHAAVSLLRDSVRLVDTRTGEITAQQPMPQCFVAIAATSDGRRVASGTDQQTRVTRILDGETLHELGRVGGHPDCARCAAFSADGTLLATASPERIVIHDAVTLEKRKSLFLPGMNPRVVRWSPDGDRLLLADAENEVRLVRWNAPPFRELSGHESFVYVAAWSADGTMIASAGWDKTVRLWDARTGAPLAVLPVDCDWVGYVGFTRDGTQVLTWIKKGYAAWDVATGRRSATYGPDHDLAASLSQGGSKWTKQGSGGQEATTSPDGTLFFAGFRGEPSGSRVTEIATGTERATVPELGGRTLAVAVSFDNRLLATSGEDGIVRLWDAATGEPRGTLAGHDGKVYSIEFSPDGERLVSGGEDGRVVLWDVESGKQVTALQPHASYVHAVAFSPDGTRILSGSGDHTLRVWDSVPWAERRKEMRRAAALRAEMRPRVERLLGELKDPAKVAARLRADETLDAAGRRAALRVLLGR